MDDLMLLLLYILMKTQNQVNDRLEKRRSDLLSKDNQEMYQKI